MGQIYLNDKPVDELPQWALDIMAERLSKVVSEYFSRHPDQYIKFLEGQEELYRRRAEEAARAAEEAANPKPKRTRRKKTETAAEQGIPDTESTKAPKKRGRPRKTSSVDAKTE